MENNFNQDPRPAIQSAIALALETVRAVPSDRLDAPTPCSEMDVRHLLGHLLFVLHRVAAIGRQENAMAIQDLTDVTADSDWVAVLDAAAESLTAAWQDDSTLNLAVVLPWASLTGAQALGMYTNELCVHTWDLAKGAGLSPTWSEDVVNFAYDSILHHLPETGRLASFEAARQNMPEGMRDFPPPFLEAVATSGDASSIERLVAWNGRDPKWAPAG